LEITKKTVKCKPNEVFLFYFGLAVESLDIFISCARYEIRASLSILMAIFPGGPGLAGTNVSILDFIGPKGDGGGVDNWTTRAIKKICKFPVKSSPPTNQHPAFYRLDAFLSPNQ